MKHDHKSDQQSSVSLSYYSDILVGAISHNPTMYHTDYTLGYTV